jgi:hypothetical protein
VLFGGFSFGLSLRHIFFLIFIFHNFLGGIVKFWFDPEFVDLVDLGVTH